MSREKSILTDSISAVESKMSQDRNRLLYTLSPEEWDLIEPILNKKWNKELKGYVSELKKLL